MKEKVAIVTGANKGIGLETCRQLARAGKKVILTARNEEKGKEAAGSLISEGLNVDFFKLDITSGGDIEGLLKYLKENSFAPEILVNNAGVYLSNSKKIKDISVEEFEETMEINLTGAFRMCRSILPLMEKEGYGRIINVSSGLGSMKNMGGGRGPYGISKAALNALTKIIADEIDRKNIKINSVCPGWVRTDMGGKNADRSVEKGAETIVSLALLADPDGPNGDFMRDNKPISF